MFNRKGDLALSTNAIVVLIIAVLVLGLLISFITGAIGKGSDRFLGELNKLPDPPEPTSSKIITSSESAVAERGEYAGFKFSVYNPFPTEKQVAPTFGTCAPVNAGSVSLAPRLVAGRSVETWTVQALIKEDASLGKPVCTISVKIVDGTESAIGNSDVVIEVRS